MADQNNVNQLLEAMKTSMVALNDTMRNYNLRIMDSFKVFQSLDTTLKNFTDSLNLSVKNVNSDIQNFGNTLRKFTSTDKSPSILNEDIKNSSDALKKFGQDLNDNIANLKDFGSEINKLSQVVSNTTEAFSAAGSDLKSTESKAAAPKPKITGKATDKAPAAPKTSNNYAAASTAGSNAANMLGRVQIAFTAIKKVVEVGVKSIALFNAGLLASVVAFQMFTNRVKAYVQAYNPNLVKQFDYVLKDVTAVIGKALQPVLVALGVAFRTLGDILIPVMDALAPAFQSLADAVKGFLLPIFNALGNALINAAPLINQLANEFAKVAEELGNSLGELMPELIRYFADYLKNKIAELKAYNNAAPLIDLWSKFNRSFLQAGTILLNAFNSFADYMKKIAMKLRSWLDWFGITTPGKNYVGTNVEPAQKKDSTGMAAREAEYMNVEELSRGLIKAAYGSGQDIARQTLQENKLQNQQLAQINAKLGNRILQPQPFQPGLRMA